MDTVEMNITYEEVKPFFDYLLTDETGSIGISYTEYNDILTKMLLIDPIKFMDIYNNYKEITLQNTLNIESTHRWFPDNNDASILKHIKYIYNTINTPSYKVNSIIPDERPLTFRYALMLWLYVWH
jgi:hypothetical protein